MEQSFMKWLAIGLTAGACAYAWYTGSQHNELQKELTRQEQEIVELKKERASQQKEVEARAAALKQQENTEQNNKRDQLQRTLVELKQKLQQRLDEADELQVALQGTPSGSGAAETLNSINEDIKVENNAIASLKNNLKKWDAAREKAEKAGSTQLERDKSTYQTLFTDLKEQIKLHLELAARYRNDLAAMKSRLIDPVVREQYALVQVKINEENHTIFELREKLAALGAQWEQVRTGPQAYGRKITSNRQYNDLKRQLQTEEAKLNELMQQNKTQKKEYTDESVPYKKLSADLKKAREAAATLQQEIAATTKLLASPQK